jgi:hypothetical protein
MTRGIAIAVLVHAAFLSASSDAARPVVSTIRVPNEGIQPQIVVGKKGAVHMVYYKGEATSGDIFYVRSSDEGRSFSTPMRVNSQADSAIAAGTIRGAHLALGKNDRVHVAWNGSGKAKPKGLPNPQLPEDSPYRHSAPMLYARLTADGTGFEKQRNLMTSTYSLDGGGSVAADGDGNVYVVWHANSSKGAPGEGARAVWVATSRDDGKTFAAESRANREETGACGCCGLRATADRLGNVFVMYRSAMNTINRDMYVLMSKDKGESFIATKLDTWKIGQCVMSSAGFHTMTDGTLASWETEHQVKFARVDRLLNKSQPRVAAPNLSQQTRKHPVLCTNSIGQVILAWTEGTGWQKGGSVAWQVFDKKGNPVADGSGQADGVPVWGLAAVFTGPNDEFTVVY